MPTKPVSAIASEHRGLHIPIAYGVHWFPSIILIRPSYTFAVPKFTTPLTSINCIITGLLCVWILLYDTTHSFDLLYILFSRFPFYYPIIYSFNRVRNGSVRLVVGGRRYLERGG